MRIKKKSLIVTIMIIVLLVACSNNVGEQMHISGEPNFAGAYHEMNSPAFWISGIENPDELIMSASQIKAFNQNVPNTDATNCVNLDEYNKQLSKAELLEKLK